MEKYQVTGMSCAACSARVEKAVAKVDGVEQVSVNLLTNTMQVEGSAAPQQIIEAVVQAGYGASQMQGSAAQSANTAAQQGNTQGGNQSEQALADKESPKIAKRLIASLVFLLPLMYVSMGHTMWGWPVLPFLNHNVIGIGLFELLFTSIVMVINQKFFVSGFMALRHGAPNMDTLVALGATASYGYSVVILFLMTTKVAEHEMEAMHALLHEFYFESAAMILTLITVGKLLEARSKGKTTDALKSLMRLAPKTATVLRPEEQVIPIEQMRLDDVFVVKPGESVPADGVVLEGSTAIDESALTGESIPVDKKPGDTVSAATINRMGHITCRATKIGQDTTLAQIIQMVSDASATKAPIAKVADKVSGIFVPTVLAIAAVTIVVWLMAGQTIGFALARGISVLVISCPCALGLATPVAIMVGNGVAARKKILFKNAISLEKASKSDIVVLDKTGTLTTGQPVVTDVMVATETGAAKVTEQNLLGLAYALEKRSEHPLAKAIVSYVEAKQEGEDAREMWQSLVPAIQEFAIEPGNGLHGLVDGERVYGGSYTYIESKFAMDDALSKQAKKFADQGKTPVFFGKGEQLYGMIAIADVLKPDAVQAVQRLHDMGKRVIMLTGDNERTANALGKEAGVDTVIANVLPQDKEAKIRSLQQEGQVIMVGDGINDAPALTRADVGIAIGAGTDVAIDAADVVLMKNEISDVPEAIYVSKKVLRNIHENLFWAFFYNVIGIPLAAGVWIPIFGWELNPMFGAAAMSLSSFCVVTNALRLNLLSNQGAQVQRKTVEVERTQSARKQNEVESIPSARTQNEREQNQQAQKNTIRSQQDARICDCDDKEISREDNKMKKTLIIEGMMCEHCQAHVTKALNAIEGVTAEVDHKAGTAVVTAERDVTDAEFKEAVEGAGYTLVEIQE